MMGVTITEWTEQGPTDVEQYVGLTVGSGSTYMGDCDTNYFAIVFDPDSCEFFHAGHSYSPLCVTIDAPEDVMAAFQAQQDAKEAQRRAAAVMEQVRERLIEESLPKPGRRVTVVRGRKIAQGTEGIVQVYCKSNFGGMRVKFVTDDGVEHWTDAYNVEVIALEVATTLATGKGA
jgi:hypothetical protein